MTSRTGYEKLYNHCMLCKYFHLEVQEGGGCLEICEVTGGRVIWSDEGLNKSDNCPFMEVEEEEFLEIDFELDKLVQEFTSRK